MATDDKPMSAGDRDPDFSHSGDISKDGGVVKEIITHGERGWQRPEAGDELQVHYKGMLTDGTVFDSSYNRGSPLNFRLGEGKVIKGWEVVVATMSKGEKAKVTLKPEYAYGEAGSPPNIPENATLIFEMELVTWTSKRDVYGDGTVIKSELQSGDGWERPGKLAQVTVNIVAHAMADDGASKGKQLFTGEKTFMLGSNEAPPAWEKIIRDMKKNSRVGLMCRPPHVGGPGAEFVPAGTECVHYELTLLRWLKMEDIFSDGTLMKKVLTEGEGWERPNEGAVVSINASYAVKSPDADEAKGGPPFEDVQNLEVKLGDGIVVDGLDRAILSMKSGETAVVCVAPEHAFGSAPELLTPELQAKEVSSSDTILVTVTLVKFQKAKDMWSMSFEEKAEEMQARKERGNEMYKAGHMTMAKKCYERAVSFFDSPTSELSPELKKRVNQLLVQCHLNLAACHDRLKDIPSVMVHCKKALEIAPSNVKALYRQGCAYLAVDDYYNAESHLRYALEMSPGNKDVKAKMRELTKKRAKQDAQDKKLYSNLFGRLSKMEEKEKARFSKPTEMEVEGAEAGTIGKDDSEMKDSAETAQ